MVAIKHLLNHLCQSHFERKVVNALLEIDECHDREAWVNVHAQLLHSAACINFDCYRSIARCHVLCIAAAPDCNELWTGIVLAELTSRATNDPSLDAYVMGSQLGLFQAGRWLQETRQMLIGGNFLAAVAQYCAGIFGKEWLPVNISDSYAQLKSAQQALDRTVKDYLRPDDLDLGEQIIPEIHGMLVELEQTDIAKYDFWAGKWTGMGCGANHWLLDALIHGSLDISHRNRSQLLRAALAINAMY